jgi:hypothetical protein
MATKAEARAAVTEHRQTLLQSARRFDQASREGNEADRDYWLRSLMQDARSFAAAEREVRRGQ